jgi:hypothetical protein
MSPNQVAWISTTAAAPYTQLFLILLFSHWKNGFRRVP